jgi:hypothetical protein
MQRAGKSIERLSTSWTYSPLYSVGAEIRNKERKSIAAGNYVGDAVVVC